MEIGSYKDKAGEEPEPTREEIRILYTPISYVEAGRIIMQERWQRQQKKTE